MDLGRETSTQSHPGLEPGGRFDTRVLSGRLPRREWRRFRAEAIAGRHGDDLTEPRWWRRSERLLGVLFLVPLVVLVPAVIIRVEGVSAFTVGVSLLWCVSMAGFGFFLWWVQHGQYWVARARVRYRLTEFARVNGMRYEPEPSVSRPAAHLLNWAPKRWHEDRFEIPGPHGFVVANHGELWDAEDGESWAGYQAGYAVLRLRESYPRTLVARRMRVSIKALGHVTPVDGPGGLMIWSTKPEYPLLRELLECGVVERVGALGRSAQIEIVGDELFVLCDGKGWPMTSQRFWARMAAVAEALAPFLDTTVATSPAGAVAIRRPADQR